MTQASNAPAAPTAISPRVMQDRGELASLRAQQRELRSQLEEVTEWRGRLVQERHNAAATNNLQVVRELDARIEEMGARSTRLERQVLLLDERIADMVGRVSQESPMEVAVGQAIRAATAPRTQVVSLPPLGPRGMDPREVAGMMMAEAVFFILGGIVLWKLAFRRGQRAALSAGAGAPRDVTQLQQSVDAIALEVERISENQRFVTKLLHENAPGSKIS